MAVDLPSKAGAEASDRKTDDLPSFKDIGASLNQKFGQTDPKDVGRAIDQNTPGTSFHGLLYSISQAAASAEHFRLLCYASSAAQQSQAASRMVCRCEEVVQIA